MSEWVLDASVVVDLLLGLAPQHLEDAMAGHQLVAPSHLDAEVLSALARLHRSGALVEDEVSRSLMGLATLPIERLPITQALLLIAWELRHNVAARDALYLALAQVRSAVVLTKDLRLRRAAPHLTLGPEDAEEG